MNVGMVSIYPQSNSKHSNSGGVASYTKNLALSLEGVKISVFVNKLDNDATEFVDGCITTYRCWNKGSFYPIQIFIEAFKKRKLFDVIHIQHEFFLYGGAISAGVFPLLPALLKLLGKKTIVTYHGVLPLSGLNNQFLKENGLSGNSTLMKLALYTIVNISSLFTTKIIVHEDFFKKRLVEDYGLKPDKIVVISHGIEDRKDGVDTKKAKKLLDLKDKKIILFFGYITGYKGIELLIDSFKYLKNNEDYVLLIAGGLHPRLKNDEKYKKYVRGLKERAGKISNNIIFTDFVPEDKIGLYFSAADVVVLPYTVAMASSGPMSLAIAYRKPILVSEVFDGVFKKKILFKKNPKVLSKKIQKCIKAPELFESSDDDRLWTSIGKQHMNCYGGR